MTDEELLSTTQSLWQNVMKLDEETCWRLLDKEAKSLRRFSIMNRLYGRATKLRTVREREKLFQVTSDDQADNNRL